MDQETSGNDLDFEHALMLHLELCHSVALALTRNPTRALALAKETLLWAWHLKDGPWDVGTIRTALLSELHDRYLCDYQLVPDRSMSCEQPLGDMEI